MLADKRRAVRRQVNWPAKIDAGHGAQLRDCVILNISDHGALIATKTAKDTPDNFTVIMSPSGFPNRRCRLVWRTSDHVGVEFDDQWHRDRAALNVQELETVEAAVWH